MYGVGVYGVGVHSSKCSYQINEMTYFLERTTEEATCEICACAHPTCIAYETDVENENHPKKFVHSLGVLEVLSDSV